MSSLLGGDFRGDAQRIELMDFGAKIEMPFQPKIFYICVYKSGIFKMLNLRID